MTKLPDDFDWSEPYNAVKGDRGLRRPQVVELLRAMEIQLDFFYPAVYANNAIEYGEVWEYLEEIDYNISQLRRLLDLSDGSQFLKPPLDNT